VERFYRELADGSSVGQALSEARARLRAEPFRWLALGPDPPTVKLQDWFVPQLYQVGPDLSLIGGDEILEKDADATPVLVKSWEERLHGFPPEPAYRFQGRARELLELGRAFEKHGAVVLAGMGGMGKTALAREAAAWWLRAGRFEEAVFCSFEQVRSVDRAVQVLGQAIEGLGFARRPAGEQQAAAVALFRARRILVVWDNFESTLPQYQEDAGGALGFDADEGARLRAFYRELTDGKPAGRLLVTCRPDDTGLPRIKRLALAGLARHDSLHLLTAIADFRDVDLERAGYERPEIEKLLDVLFDHPLSISLVAPHLGSLTPEEIRTDFARHLDRFRDDTAEEGRNRSLRASLAFSASRLSEAARAVLPWLAWFQGGAFESRIVKFTGLEADAWASVRRELESTALVRVEDLAMFTNPFIRFHPTLPYAALADGVLDIDAAEQRFLAVYLGVSREVRGALNGQTAAAGMELMAREEANVRAAIDRAFRRGERQTGWHMADTLQIYLERAGRRRERDALAAWVRSRMPEDAGLDGATCASIRSHAQGLFAQGRLQEAVEALQGLAVRLESEGLADGGDPTLQIGTTYGILGQILDEGRQPRLAIEACRRAIEYLEKAPGEDARSNLSATLGSLANALSRLGRHDEALEAAERGVAIDEELERHRNAAAGHGRCAQILADQGRYAEADARYEKALDLARQVNDLELQGAILQHQGVLSRKRGDLPRSVELFEQAIGLFQRANNRGGEMLTYDLLASTEAECGHLDAAEAWYARSRELAEALDDRAHLAVIAHNVGILFQTRAEQAGDPAERDALLRRAVASIETSLAIKLERNDQVGAASSYFQVGVLHQMLGDLDRAEEQLRKALQIHEPLNLPDVWKTYAILADVAEARGDAEAAAAWAAKRDAKREELRRLAGGGSATLPEEVTQAFLALAQTVYAARTSGGELPAEIAEVLAQLAGQSEPLASAGSFLRAVAAGGSPPVPSGLPEPLAKIFGGLLASLG
jgi:tetratricopeptide (TPR) repeat protein